MNDRVFHFARREEKRGNIVLCAYYVCTIEEKIAGAPKEIGAISVQFAGNFGMI